ncbi:TetR family transcriptional regulator C-terminal domain-containing protein [Arthrobacter oryzae]|uniref:TetR/AcrR family transcriptional regulator n=1 Tax=Arthrobacter oryzae TaxID=409290 RepID=UPI0028667758|nr:TetR family transcriptional regulator C-terminal domain-containing protein [Arthrobacter oryzae]MDR6505479.1 AcrR family transcriptional regulator [Arthrobacter oryzae]
MPKIVDAAVRRQEVVEAVFRIIAADGLERASLREVADEAGLAVGSVRHYFASSDELLAHSFGVVVDRITGRLDAAREDLLQLAPGTAGHRDGVLTLLGQFLPLDEERAVDACVWMAFKNAARIRPFLAAEADRSHRAVAAVVGWLIMELQAPGETGDDDGHQFLVTEAERLLATLDGLTMHALLQPEWMTAEMCRDVLASHLQSLGESRPGH